MLLLGTTEEDQGRADAVRRLVEDHFRPLEREIDATDDVAPDVLRGLRRHAAALGSLGFNLPEELGGGGLNFLSQSVLGIEMGRVTTVLSEQVGQLPDSLLHVDEEQRRWLLDPLLSGEQTIAYALSEPGGGSDLSAARCRAVRDGAEWTITGNKQFISNAAVADHILLLAVTDPGASLRDRFTVFIVPRETEGLHVVERYRTMGWHGHHLNALSFDGAVVGDQHVLGEVGHGFAVMMTTINGARLNVASRCLGAASIALEEAVRFAVDRPIGNRRLADLGMSQQKIADMDLDLHAAAALVGAAARTGDERGTSDAGFRIAVSRAKLYASEMAGRVTDTAIQLLGAAGYTNEYPVERIARDVRGYRIGEGTSEIQRIQIARHVTRGVSR